MNKRLTRTVACLGLLLLVLIAVPSATAQTAQAKRLVIIDAAHGGTDAGVMVTDKIREKEITLVLAQLMQKEMAKFPGIQSQLTRTSDKTVANAERVKMARKPPGDVVFISLHVNAGFGKKAAIRPTTTSCSAAVSSGKIGSANTSSAARSVSP